jgi:hypothetical protein
MDLNVSKPQRNLSIYLKVFGVLLIQS